MQSFRLGGLWDDEIKHQAGSVWDVNFLAPTLDTMTGGGREPHILEVKKLDNTIFAMDNENYEYGRKADIERLKKAVCDGEQHLCKLNKMPDGKLSELNDGEICDIDSPYASTVTARYYKGIGAHKDNMVFEGRKIDAASLRMVRTEEGKALRKQYEAGELHHGFNEFREAEPRKDGLSNTITTVQKDNYLVEKLFMAIDEQNMTVRSETVGTLTTDGNSPKHNNRIAEVNKLGNIGDVVTQGRSVFDKEGISPTLISGMSHGNTVPYVTEEKSIKIRQATEQGYTLCEIGGAADLDYPTSQTRRGRVIENGKICPTLTTENIPNVIELGNEKFYNFIYKFQNEWWLIRIRKLTPRECWRLMGFYDEDFDKAEKVNSNTQLYKQAGNSIVVNVLEEIFKQMIGE